MKNINELNKHLSLLIKYNWEDEMKNFEEEFDLHIMSQSTLEDWIEVCEAKNNEFMCNHIFYTLMKLKQFLN